MTEFKLWGEQYLYQSLSSLAGQSYGKKVDWMDSMDEEIQIWKRMLANPNSWVEGELPLRSSMTPRKWTSLSCGLECLVSKEKQLLVPKTNRAFSVTIPNQFLHFSPSLNKKYFFCNIQRVYEICWELSLNIRYDYLLSRVYVINHA